MAGRTGKVAWFKDHNSITRVTHAHQVRVVAGGEGGSVLP